MQRSKFLLSFCWGISMFFCICPSKKYAEAIKFLGILKKYVSKNKIYFYLKKEKQCFAKSYFCLSHDFQTWFHNIDHLLYYPQMSVFIETLLTLPYLYNWLNFNKKMNEKRNQEYQSVDPEYLTGQINSHLWRRFCRLIFASSRKC